MDAHEIWTVKHPIDTCYDCTRQEIRNIYVSETTSFFYGSPVCDSMGTLEKVVTVTQTSDSFANCTFALSATNEMATGCLLRFLDETTCLVKGIARILFVHVKDLKTLAILMFRGCSEINERVI
jgi:hypothetical protein